MSELETELRKAADGNNLNGVTIFASPKGWQASVRWKSNLGWTVEHDADPVQALVRALRSSTRYEGEKLERPAAPAPAKPEPVLSGGLFD